MRIIWVVAWVTASGSESKDGKCAARNDGGARGGED